MNFTKEQQSAIDIRNKNILVSAAAGSGKTAILVERIISLINDKENPTNIDEFLIVTFTKAAANEMKERILKKILELINNGVNVKHLSKQIILINRAIISTIHSFGLEVIKDNFEKISINPKFKILDEIEGKVAINDIVDDIFETQYGLKENYSFYELINSYTNKKNDTELKELIINLYTNLMQNFINPFKWLEKKIIDYEIKDDNNLIIKEFKQNIQDKLKYRLNILDKLIDIAENVDGLEKYCDVFNNDIAIYEELINNFEFSINKFINSMRTIKFSRMPSISKDVECEEKEYLKLTRDKYIKGYIKELNEKVFIKDYDEMIGDIKKQRKIFEKIYEIIILIHEKYKSYKLVRGKIDFSDIEHYAYEILSSEKNGRIVKSDIAKKLSEKYKYIFIDEYQDINEIQDSILMLSSRYDQDIPNLFMVGDIKQSIYKFRGANPKIFSSKYIDYKKDDDKNIVVDLNKNFRSRKIVLDTINHIFKKIMSYDIGEIEYDKDAMLYEGNKYEGIPNDCIYSKDTELHLINQELLKQNSNKNMSKINLEAHYVAGKIEELIRSKIIIYDKEENVYRKIQYKDICILVRSKNRYIEDYIKVFNEYDIPLYTDDDKGYFNSIEIRNILNVLRIIDNQFQDIPLLGVLRSQMFNITCDELIIIKLKTSEGMFIEKIKEYIQNFNNVLSDKLNYFINMFTDWRKYSDIVDVYDMIYKIYMDTNYHNKVLLMNKGELRAANLKLLLIRAEEYESTSFKGINSFIRFIDQAMKNNKDFYNAKIIGEKDNVVKLMTIHKSKGLEFPVVFLCGLEKKFNDNYKRESIILNNKIGIASKYIDTKKGLVYPTISRYIVEEQIKKESIAEELRILYVALTRAREKLIMVGSEKNIDKKVLEWKMQDSNTLDKNYIMNCKSYLDLIGASVYNDYNLDLPLKIINVDSIDDEGNEINKTIKFKLDNKFIDEDIIVNIKKKHDWEYNYKQVIDLPVKMTVTELKNFNLDKKSDDLKKPEFLNIQNKYSSAQIGIIYHKIMRYIDFSKNLDSEIGRLINNNIITELELEAVDKNKINIFLNTEIANRAKKAQEIYKEKPFFVNYYLKEIDNSINNDEKILVQGVVDCYFIEDGEIVLIDYKTDRVSSERELVTKYNKQLYMYKYALEKILNIRVKESIIYSFCLDEEINIKY